VRCADSTALGKVAGILLVKNLITLDPKDATTVQHLFDTENAMTLARHSSPAVDAAWDTAVPTRKIWRTMLRVHKDISIFALIDLFQAQKTQMALVYDYDPKSSGNRMTNGAGWIDSGEALDERVLTAALKKAFKTGHVLADIVAQDVAGGGQTLIGAARAVPAGPALSTEPLAVPGQRPQTRTVAAVTGCRCCRAHRDHDAGRHHRGDLRRAVRGRDRPKLCHVERRGDQPAKAPGDAARAPGLRAPGLPSVTCG
jgi:hypothetical protein